MHFSYSYPTPVLPPYLFEADVTTSIVPPQSFVAVPGVDAQIHLYWTKHQNTVDPLNDLYAEVYRTRDLQAWDLVSIRQWLNYDYYVDEDVQVGFAYYYRIRFVRKDADDEIIAISDYTTVLAGRVVSALGFEPRDEYSNKFLNELLNNLPGTRIYDRTTAATFSADEQLWQTTCRILDSFRLTVDGSVAHEEAADPTALYAKRPVSFLMSKKHVKLQGQDLVTGETGPQILVSAYLIHTFLQSYANQFMALCEKYLQIVTNKYIDYSQVYTKGFHPTVTSVVSAPIAELYESFGKFMRLKPLKAQTTAQGFNRYRATLQDNFTNVENVGKVAAIGQACKDTLGITTQKIIEYYKQHWFKSDRETKLYTIPDVADPYRFSTGLEWGANNNLIFDLKDPRFTAFIEYVVSPLGVGIGWGEGYLEVAGSGPDNPYTYLFRVHISGDPQVAANCTTASEVIALFTDDPLANSLLTVTPSVGGPGGASGVIYSGFASQLVRAHSLWLGWEDHEVNMYGRKFKLQDSVSPLDTGTDYATTGITISERSPENPIPSTISATTPDWLANTDSNISVNATFPVPAVTSLRDTISPYSLIAARDDNEEGVGYGVANRLIYGEKRILFRVGLTESRMQWLTKATLKIFIRLSTAAGYLRLYRIRKRYDINTACWNFRKRINIPDSGVTYSWSWNGTEYVPIATGSGEDWVTEDWGTDGAKDTSDAIFLKEFYINKIDNAYPTWASLDVTDVLQNIYKYEASRLDMGDDPENILYTGFMITADGFENRAAVVISSPDDATFKPRISWESLPHGVHQCSPDQTKYFYIDGTTRYGRMLVQESATEPTSYIMTVNERIRQQDIQRTSDVAVSLSAAPAAWMATGVKVYGTTTTAVGVITAISSNVIYVTMAIRNFQIGESIRMLTDSTSTASIISAIVYGGNMSVRLSRMPVSDSLLRVYHTAVATTPATPPASYPDYATWTEAGAGISPVFVAAPEGILNPMATRNVNDPDVIDLNVSDDLTKGGIPLNGDVIVTYQYMYDYALLGRAVTDSDSISALEGCNRVGNGLIIQRENDYLYKSEVMLPEPSTGTIPDISGDSVANEYSDHNLSVLCQAIHNIRRQDGQVDVFKYDVEGKPYFRFGQQYHKFFERV